MPIMRHIWIVGIVTLLFAVIVPTSAIAVTCTAAVTNVDFGAPNLLSASPTDELATVTVTCNGITGPDVVKLCPNIDDGTGGSSGQTRYLKGQLHALTLSYDLYEDAAHTAPWGSVTHPQLGTVPAIILNHSTETVTRTLYARLPGGQSTSPADHYESSFQGAEAAFAWSEFTSTQTSDCTGFSGQHTIEPSFDVIASPSAGCTLATADMTFPNAGVLNHVVTGQTTLGVTCTNMAPYSISLDNGQNGSSPTSREMKSPGGDLVTYVLYRDSAHTLPWGAASSGQGDSGTGLGTQQTYTVYGQVPIQTTPRPATYTDRVVVTITY